MAWTQQSLNSPSRLRLLFRALLTACLLSLAACIPTAPSDAPRLTHTPGFAERFPTAIPSATAIATTVTADEGNSILIPEISLQDWQRGEKQAQVTFLVYGDYLSVQTQLLNQALLALVTRHPLDVRYIFRSLSDTRPENSGYLAAMAAEAAGKQNAFWEMHTALLSRQTEWAFLNPTQFTEWLLLTANEIGLDADQLLLDLEDEELITRHQQQVHQAVTAGIVFSPVVFMNNTHLSISPNLDELEAMFQFELLKARQFDTYPLQIIDLDSSYRARIQLSSGELLVYLYSDTAPLAVNNFVFLAEQGWYDQNPIYYVQPDRWIETGDPTGTGLAGPGYSYITELSPLRNFNGIGIIGLVASGPDANGSRFFITLQPEPQFNESHTVLGKVIAGMEYLQGLSARTPIQHLLEEPEVWIETILIERIDS